MIDVDLIFDEAPQWVALFEEPDSPAIFLTPIDWTEYEYARGLSLAAGTQVVNPRLMLERLIQFTRPTAWRGFARGGAAIPFDVDLLRQVCCSNAVVGLAFDTRIGKMAARITELELARRKNSGAGSGTPSETPGSKNAEKAAPSA